MRKWLGPVVVILLIAASLVVENAHDHLRHTAGDWGLWIAVGLAWGALWCGVALLIGAALVWLSRRGGRAENDPP